MIVNIDGSDPISRKMFLKSSSLFIIADPLNVSISLLIFVQWRDFIIRKALPVGIMAGSGAP